MGDLVINLPIWVLDMRQGRYIITVPSMQDWLISNYGRGRSNCRSRIRGSIGARGWISVSVELPWAHFADAETVVHIDLCLWIAHEYRRLDSQG